MGVQVDLVSEAVAIPQCSCRQKSTLEGSRQVEKNTGMRELNRANYGDRQLKRKRRGFVVDGKDAQAEDEEAKENIMPTPKKRTLSRIRVDKNGGTTYAR